MSVPVIRGAVFRAAAVLLAAAAAWAPARPARADGASDEPDAASASRWWPELTHVYTPIGWKNHLFRFNVFYNGLIIANPQPEPDIKALDAWAGLGVQILPIPSEKGLDPDRWRFGTFQMSGECGRTWGYQGLLDNPTPVLWTEWRQAYRSAIGYILRQEAFAHVPGGRDIQTGTEPLFAWLRYSIREVNPIMTPEPCHLLFRINKPHYVPEMYEGRNAALRQTDARYPRRLKLERIGDPDRPGALLVEPDGRIRLAILPGRAESVALKTTDPPREDQQLVAVFPARKGAHIDVLLPLVPEERDVVLKEMAVGRDPALAECDAYWSRRPATAATIDTPEPYVNAYLQRNAQYAEIIAQRMPDTGHYTNLTGSLVYARMWATPTTMFDTMLLDTLGYHDAVARYLEIFRDTQGTVRPPGPGYTTHPGYFATPKSLTACDWLSDHGAVLHAVCHHALLTDDEAFVARWREPVVRACEFIRDARARTDHDGVKGVLPGAVATDLNIPTQAVWNIGWHYKGLTSAVEMLRRAGDPRAAVFEREAGEFRRVFVEALREQTRRMPVWTDAGGTTHRIVPSSLSAGDDFTHAFYLDAGPLFLVYAGLLRADDPLMASTLAFFREGPNHRVYDRFGHHEQPAVLIHELSSCEPPASWNFFHSHQLADRPRFLEGLYSMLTGAHSQRTYIACETRGGVTGLPGHIGIYGVRLAAVDDIAEPGTLSLLRMTPRGWFRTDRQTRFDDIPTRFGPVTVRFQLTGDGAELRVDYASRFHHPPDRVVLYVPPLEKLGRVALNGRAVPAVPGGVLDVTGR